jgi:hypothetical protein
MAAPLVVLPVVSGPELSAGAVMLSAARQPLLLKLLADSSELLQLL